MYIIMYRVSNYFLGHNSFISMLRAIKNGISRQAQGTWASPLHALSSPFVLRRCPYLHTFYYTYHTEAENKTLKVVVFAGHRLSCS